MTRDLAATPVRDIRSDTAVSVTADTPAAEVIQIMVAKRCGAMLIVDGAGRLTGIFTERDVLLRSMGGDLAWQKRPVGEVMTPSPVTVGDGDTLEDALRRMRGGRFRHLPVVHEGKPVGVVSIRDVLSLVAERFPKEVVNLPPMPSRRPQALWGG
ncbi:MAG: CBS domain-containing protein [Polyangiaceae bacterium]|nr:CBS domain-containing protein [Polyangiaceae bacterium]